MTDPTTDPAALRALIARVEAANFPTSRPNLLAELQAEGLLTVQMVNLGNYIEQHRVTMAGITADSTSGRGVALSNWCALARHALGDTPEGQP